MQDYQDLKVWEV